MREEMWNAARLQQFACRPTCTMRWKPSLEEWAAVEGRRRRRRQWQVPGPSALLWPWPSSSAGSRSSFKCIYYLSTHGCINARCLEWWRAQLPTFAASFLRTRIHVRAAATCLLGSVLRVCPTAHPPVAAARALCLGTPPASRASQRPAHPSQLPHRHRFQSRNLAHHPPSPSLHRLQRLACQNTWHRTPALMASCPCKCCRRTPPLLRPAAQKLRRRV